MKKTVYKAYEDTEKVERWLGEMSASGWQLRTVWFYRYVFEQDLSVVYAYPKDESCLLENPTKTIKYIGFMEETGAEFVCSFCGVPYFRKRVDSGDFDLHSDVASRIKYLNRLLRINSAATYFQIFAAVFDFICFLSEGNYLLLGLALFPAFMTCVQLYIVVRLLKKKKRLQKEGRLHE